MKALMEVRRSLTSPHFLYKDGMGALHRMKIILA